MKNTVSPALRPRFAHISLAAIFIASGYGIFAFAQNATPGDQAEFNIKAESRLVLVNVVVRDKNGHPVEGLSKEDFKLLDRGKEQTIQQFEAEKADAGPAPSADGNKPTGQTQSTSSAAASYTALFFDNLNDSEADLVHARDAARQYLANNVGPTNRIAIFTSDKLISGFAADSQHAADALSQIQPSLRSRHREGAQPFDENNITDYQAIQMLQTEDCEHTNAWLVATAPTGGCNPLAPVGMQGSTKASNPHISELRMKARDVIAVSQSDTRSNFQQLQAIVKYISGAPGRRTLILVSSGFLSQSEQNQLDQITELALRSQVVISGLDPAGLTAGDGSVASHASSVDPKTNSARAELDRARSQAATDVLQEFANGTGGQFIQNENDLTASLQTLGLQPAHYTLGFNPGNLKDDGKYHELKVTLRDPKGMRVQARKGYFASTAAAVTAIQPTASKPSESSEGTQPPPSHQAAPATNPAATDPQTQLKNKVDAALKSKEELLELPVGMQLNASGTLSVLTHLDTAPLQFSKEDGHNRNTISFTVAVLDQNDAIVSAKQRSVKLNATDAEIEALRGDGLEITTEFALQPGTYRVRAVVADSVEGKVAAISRSISIP